MRNEVKDYGADFSFFNLSIYILLGLSLAGYLFIGYFLSRPDFLQYISIYVFLFAVYVLILKQSPNRESDLKLLTGIAMLFRIVFLLSVPTLSDDYFRFIWDGKMWTAGINPYTEVPSESIQSFTGSNHYLATLFAGMNSRDFYTVYPPVCQFIFGLSAKLFPDNLQGSVTVMRIFCIASDAGTIWLLQKILPRLNQPKNNVLFYALNPLVIIELSGNIHFEAIMIFFFVLAIYLLIRYHSESGPRSFLLSAIAYALGIATKLIPLIFLPFLLRRFTWKQTLVYFLITGVIFFLLFIPFLNKDLLFQIGSSVDLYFRKFEFNASLFYVVRWLGFQIEGYDVIQKVGLWMGMLTFLLITFLAVREKINSWKSFFIYMQWSLTIYYLFATTVHPWYITTLVMLSVFTNYRFAIVWSLFIAFSYFTYHSLPYQENLWLTSVEYGMVLLAVGYELYRSTRSREEMGKTY